MSSSRIGVGRRTRRSAESGEALPPLRKDLPIAPAPGFFPESLYAGSILLCRAENEGMLEVPPRYHRNLVAFGFNLFQQRSLLRRAPLTA